MLKTIIISILLVFSTVSHAKQSEVECLAKNIYHEARGEPPLGQLLVAKVTINRLHTGRFGKTICEVVYQPKQFSWTTNKHKIIKDQKHYKEILEFAHLLLHTNVLDLIPYNILYFHAKHVNPAWPFKKLVQVGNHIFYV